MCLIYATFLTKHFLKRNRCSHYKLTKALYSDLSTYNKFLNENKLLTYSEDCTFFSTHIYSFNYYIGFRLYPKIDLSILKR